MKFDKRHKIEKAAATEDTRYAIGHVLFESDDNGTRLVATNGRILAVVPVTEAEGDVAGMVSSDTIKQACKNRTKGSPDALLHLPDEKRALAHTKAGVVEAPRPDDGSRFPSYRAVVPTGHDLEVTLSAKYLKDLIDALGADGITLKFKTTGGRIDGPVLVTPVEDGNDAYGVIMPISAS